MGTNNKLLVICSANYYENDNVKKENDHKKLVTISDLIFV
jgi:hypothetical protein